MKANEKQNVQTKTITFGGGCFWCTEAIFRHTKGVLDVKSGFSGGFIKNPAYKEVCTGKTGHAEVIQVIYNPEIIDLVELFTIHLLTHNPTTFKNKPGIDKGSQYRSIIFYNDDKEKEIAEEVIEASQSFFDQPIVTELKPFERFFEAEESHQNYYAENSEAFYCTTIINPKLDNFKKTLAQYFVS